MDRPAEPVRASDLFDRPAGPAQPVEHQTLGPIELVGQAVTLSRTPSRLETASPDQGEHTDQILGELGYSVGDIARLRERGVV